MTRSRSVRAAGGSADLSSMRRAGSKWMDAAFRRGLSLPLHDLSSGFRLYRRSAVNGYLYAADDFDVLQEILVRAYADGYRVLELGHRRHEPPIRER